MTTLTAENARLLFIFDNDYGELTQAMYLLHGQEIANRATFLLPSRLFATNGEGLNVQTREYRSYQDLIAVIDMEQPDIVFLCSGYLFPIHNLLSGQSLSELLRFLRGKGCQIVTTDPFWGLMSMSDPLTERDNAHPLKLFRIFNLPLKRYFILRPMAEPTRLLKDMLHVHLFPVNTNNIRSVSFFNPLLIDAQVEPDRDRVTIPGSTDRRFWLFILGQEDYKIQKWLWGKGGRGKRKFANLTAKTLQQTLKAGRHPIFIGPDDCIRAIKKRMRKINGVSLLTFCSYDRFMSLLVQAEYVFYWNAVSNTSMIRLLNNLPVFYLNRGHLSYAFYRTYERALQWYYRGWEPTYLDQERELEIDSLEKLAREYRDATIRIREELRSSPTPEEMIQKILCDTPKVVGD